MRMTAEILKQSVLGRRPQFKKRMTEREIEEEYFAMVSR